MNHAQNVRDAIDLIDETPHGKMEALFDRMASDADRAVVTQTTLLGALEGMVLVCGRTGNSLEDFEEQAEAFQRETGMMRPGKDMSMTSARDDDYEARRLRYQEWVQEKLTAGRAGLAQVQP